MESGRGNLQAAQLISWNVISGGAFMPAFSAPAGAHDRYRFRGGVMSLFPMKSRQVCRLALALAACAFLSGSAAAQRLRPFMGTFPQRGPIFHSNGQPAPFATSNGLLALNAGYIGGVPSTGSSFASGQLSQGNSSPAAGIYYTPSPYAYSNPWATPYGYGAYGAFSPYNGFNGYGGFNGFGGNPYGGFNGFGGVNGGFPSGSFNGAAVGFNGMNGVVVGQNGAGFNGFNGGFNGAAAGFNGMNGFNGGLNGGGFNGAPNGAMAPNAGFNGLGGFGGAGAFGGGKGAAFGGGGFGGFNGNLGM
jgi:hypothetical protein